MSCQIVIVRTATGYLKIFTMNYLLLTFIAIVLWASLATIASSLSHLPPFLILSIGLLIGGSLSLPKWRSWKVTLKLLIIGVSGIFGYHFLLFMALRLAPPVSANLLNYLWPLFILLLTPMFFKDLHLSKLNIFGACISFLGALLLVGSGDNSWSLDYLIGYGLALFAAVTWATYSLISKKIRSFSSSTVGLFCLLSGVMAFIAHLTFETRTVIVIEDWLNIVLLGLGPLGIAFYCWDSAIKKGDPRVIATLSYLTPLISTSLLTLFSNNTLGPNMVVAMLLIVAGAFVANLAVLIPRKFKN